MKNLLITGGCGFIGSNFIRYLMSESDFKGRIINVDKLTYAGNLENLRGVDDGLPDRYCFEKGDIADRRFMAAVFKKYPIDAVCHLAAESHVDRSIVSPDDFIKTNIEGTYVLLELCRKHWERLVLFHHVSTDEVFGSLGSEGYFTESTPYDPSSPYSASKAASDHLVRAYHRTYHLPVTLSNCSNNYGPYQFPEKLIPLVILNALEEKPIPVYGDGRQIRDWLYVRDHCRAIWMIMNQGARGSTYNVGGRCEVRNIEVVTKICDMLDKTKPLSDNRSRRDLIQFVKDRPGHDARYAIDSSRLEKEMGWRVEETFDSGLAKTIKWYLHHKEWVEQIKSGEYRRWIKEHYHGNKD
jgi:dTDP-glucose 4,6-dehydratase